MIRTFTHFLSITGCCIFILLSESVKAVQSKAESDDKKLAIQTVSNSAAKKMAKPEPVMGISDLCVKSLTPFPGAFEEKVITEACAKVQLLDGCSSVQGVPIFHYNREGIAKNRSRILVFSLIHGDETPAGSVGRLWMERLQGIDPRNTWRVVPVLNPDGVKQKTRTNANKVDVNRNFPTLDWEEKAHKYWQRDSRANPRRFPGQTAASEPETQCALKHIEDFKPDFVVSIHTPLKVLDFDGPKVRPPKYDYLPWKSLGHYPGSLGRFMWFERQIPVLTMELKEDLPNSTTPFVELQDVIGVLVSMETKGIAKEQTKAAK